MNRRDKNCAREEEKIRLKMQNSQVMNLITKMYKKITYRLDNNV